MNFHSLSSLHLMKVLAIKIIKPKKSDAILGM